MQLATRHRWIRTLCALAFLSLLIGCPPPPGAGPNGTTPPSGGGSGGGSEPPRTGSVDPYTCGNYAAVDFGRRLQAFLIATVTLEHHVSTTEKMLRDTCVLMGGHLGMAAPQLRGGTREVCLAMAENLRAALDAGLQAQATLDMQYTPAVCTVNVEAAARAAAECEARAQADVDVYCQGYCAGSCQGACQGTCQGRCNGTCHGTTGAGGECNGECEGTCEGSCQGSCHGSCAGGCQGYADVDAEASCEAHAEVVANVEAECTEPELEVEFDASLVGDLRRLEAATRAIDAGLPRILMIKARAQGPLLGSFRGWSRSTLELVTSGPTFLASIGEQALCVFGQVQAAAQALAAINVSIDVQIEVSASIEASATGSAGGGVGAAP